MITSSINTSKTAFAPNKISKTLAQIGGFIPKSVADFCDLTTKASLKRTTHFAVIALCVLFARYIQARNKDEKREILTRDTGMVFTAVYAVPFFKKIASFFINKKTGIPIASGEKGFSKNLNPEKGLQMASYEQLAEWLSVKNIESFNGIKNGFAGFCINIKKIGGDLTKCFNILDKNSKNTVNDIAKSLKINEEITNNNIIKLIIKAEKSTDREVKQKLNSLKTMFVGENKLLTKASHFKSVTEAGCIAATAFILGGLLPWFNIQYTKKLYEKKNMENKDLSKDKPKTVSINI
ncbi:MAG: hypothetical protein WCG23_10575 [bacterium]